MTTRARTRLFNSGFKVLQAVSSCFKQAVPSCFKPSCFKPSCFKLFKLFQAVLSCFKLFQAVYSCFKLFIAASSKLFQASCFKQAVSSCFKQAVSSCFKPSCLKLFKAQSGPRPNHNTTALGSGRISKNQNWKSERNLKES